MPGTIIELHGSRTPSRSIDGGEVRFLYFIFGEPDEATAYDLVLANSPGEWYGYTRREIDMGERPTLGQWFPIVTYQIPEFTNIDPLPFTGDPGDGTPGSGTGSPSSPSSAAPPDGELIQGVSFAVGTETQRVFRSFATVSAVGLSGATPPDFGKLIGVSPDDKLEGVDVPVAVSSFRRRAVLKNVTQKYFRNLQKVVGKTNEVDWWGYPAESLYLAGVTGTQRNESEFELEFEFHFREPKDAETIRTGLTIPARAGWHHVWTYNREEVDTTANIKIIAPVAVYVERILGVANFSYLGI